MNKQKALFEEAEEAVKAAHAKALEAKTRYEAAKFQVEAIKRKNKIEEIFWRFPVVGKQIIEKLDNQSLTKCRSVSKSWQRCVDREKILLVREIQEYISMTNSNVTKSLQRLSYETLKEMATLLKCHQNKEDFSEENTIKIRFWHHRYPFQTKLDTIQILFALVDATRNKHINILRNANKLYENCLKYEPKNNAENSSLNHDEIVLFLIKLILNKSENKDLVPDFKHSIYYRGYRPSLLKMAIVSQIVVRETVVLVGDVGG